ncbi:MAG TPA: hypothetical protein VII52_10315 [Gemmatimonadaceae bacterium]
MRALILPFALWAGALQAALPGQSNAEVYSAAAALASITVMVYRLGVWRQEMVNTKHNVGAEVARYREESAEQFGRLEHRFSAVERFIETATEHRIGVERWQSRVDATLEAMDESLDRLGHTPDANRRSRQGVA